MILILKLFNGHFATFFGGGSSNMVRSNIPPQKIFISRFFTVDSVGGTVLLSKDCNR